LTILSFLLKSIKPQDFNPQPHEPKHGVLLKIIQTFTKLPSRN
jgi:hypothetical protein